MTDHENPYATARIRGRVVDSKTGDEAFEVIDRLAVRYTGEPFPMRPPTSVLYYIEPRKVSSMQLPFQHRSTTA